MIYLGFDPGLQGGIAAIDQNSKMISINPMPLIGNKDYDVEGLYGVIENIVWKKSKVLATIEKQQAMPGQGLSSTLKTGMGFGILIGLVTALRIPYQIVPPQKWQHQLFAGLPPSQDTKVKSAIIAKRLFPGVDFKRTDKCKKDSDGMTDAACIAEYGRRSGSQGGLIADETDICEHVVLQENPGVCHKCGKIL